MTVKTLFYSWQSDLDQSRHHYYIEQGLKTALAAVHKDISLEVSLDKGTTKTKGSPDIADTIFKKIRAADIFVADVTIINPGDRRLTPNPNVLIELGYAIHALGWERIICVMNNTACKPEDLPFDIRKNRTTTYNFKGDAKAAATKLARTLTKAVKAIADDYEGIVDRFQDNGNLRHDQQLFSRFDVLASQAELFGSVDFVSTSLRCNDHYYHLWMRLDGFHRTIENHFLNGDIQSAFDYLAAAVSKFHLYTATKLFAEKSTAEIKDDLADLLPDNMEISAEEEAFQTEQAIRYSYPREARDGNWNAYNERLYATQDEFNRLAEEVKDTYKAFRLEVKKHLLI